MNEKNAIYSLIIAKKYDTSKQSSKIIRQLSFFKFHILWKYQWSWDQQIRELRKCQQ